MWVSDFITLVYIFEIVYMKPIFFFVIIFNVVFNLAYHIIFFCHLMLLFFLLWNETGKGNKKFFTVYFLFHDFRYRHFSGQKKSCKVINEIASLLQAKKVIRDTVLQLADTLKGGHLWLAVFFLRIPTLASLSN